jgi:hypothetical protein
MSRKPANGSHGLQGKTNFLSLPLAILRQDHPIELDFPDVRTFWRENRDFAALFNPYGGTQFTQPVGI